MLKGYLQKNKQTNKSLIYWQGLQYTYIYMYDPVGMHLPLGDLQQLFAAATAEVLETKCLPEKKNKKNPEIAQHAAGKASPLSLLSLRVALCKIEECP